jgi:hypothetical protein
MISRAFTAPWIRRAALLGLLLALCAGPLSGTEPVSMGDLVGYRGILVPPVERADVTKLVDAGTIDADGYTYVVLNLAGEVKENPPRSGGIVGALLVPDVAPFDKVLTQLNVVALPLEIRAAATAETHPYFWAKQVRFEVGFPRYRVLLYNTTGTTATVAFFAYRSH